MGFAEIMIASLKNNALAKRKRIYDRANQLGGAPIPIRKHYVPPTAEELEALAKETKRVTRALMWKRVMALSVSIAILGLVFYLLFLFYEMASSNHWEKYIFGAIFDTHFSHHFHYADFTLIEGNLLS